jgi:hypothetical protein
LGKSGQQKRHSGDIAIVFSGLIGAAKIDILNFLARNLGHFLKEAFNCLGREIIGPDGRQDPSDFPNRRS